MGRGEIRWPGMGLGRNALVSNGMKRRVLWWLWGETIGDRGEARWEGWVRERLDGQGWEWGGMGSVTPYSSFPLSGAPRPLHRAPRLTPIMRVMQRAAGIAPSLRQVLEIRTRPWLTLLHLALS